ncbi:RNA polymerase II-associated protein 1 [Apiospora saccharicola]|uniref:RNA polymerase II transcription factor B subunit 3 n=1 Tax=Apiospora saccharicola TaxID=335842 RepID=A0ABR1TME0_9PEZI
MSRKAVTSTVTQPSNAILPSDICPVCKRVRYLNTDMRFLINPECYHAMCSQCVDNIFKSGPAQCPYASCSKTLRLRGFREAWFGDLSVEREVDIRKRVAAVFNNTQDDFETLRDYNNYLQDVEDLTFALVSGTDEERRKAEAQLISYEEKNKADIDRNRKKGREAEAARKRREAEAEAASKARRLEELREEEEARQEEATINREVMEALQGGEQGSAAQIQERILAQKRKRIAQINGQHFPSSLDSGPSSMLSIRGLKAKRNGPTEDEEDRNKPYDPFGATDLDPTRYTVHESYENTWLDPARTRDDHRVPGYSVQEYVTRAMFEAFAGLGVVIDEEKAGAQRAVGTAGAKHAAQKNTTTGAARKVSNDIFG